MGIGSGTLDGCPDCVPPFTWLRSAAALCVGFDLGGDIEAYGSRIPLFCVASLFIRERLTKNTTCAVLQSWCWPSGEAGQAQVVITSDVMVCKCAL